MWDERYSSKEYIYGKTANDFLIENAGKLKKNTILSLGEGEGRNAVFLASQGFEVTALDASQVGLQKSQKLASEKGVRIKTLHSDLSDYTIAAKQWDSIISIFCHLPPAVRARLHQGIIKGLKVNGIFLLEAYTPEQLTYGTGGPPSQELMLTLDELNRDFSGLQILHGLETVRQVDEGRYHNGPSAVVQFIAQKIS